MALQAQGTESVKLTAPAGMSRGLTPALIAILILGTLVFAGTVLFIESRNYQRNQQINLQKNQAYQQIKLYSQCKHTCNIRKQEYKHTRKHASVPPSLHRRYCHYY
jgi:type II secretory pathway pseudopilin PulG